jgi:hypothetical protein
MRRLRPWIGQPPKEREFPGFSFFVFRFSFFVFRFSFFVFRFSFFVFRFSFFVFRFSFVFFFFFLSCFMFHNRQILVNGTKKFKDAILPLELTWYNFTYKNLVNLN